MLKNFGTFSNRIGIPAVRKIIKKKLKRSFVTFPFNELLRSAILKTMKYPDLICAQLNKITRPKRCGYGRLKATHCSPLPHGFLLSLFLRYSIIINVL